MSKFDKFKSNYEESIAGIKKYLIRDDIGPLIKWLLETEINPYSFLENYDASGFNSAESFYCLCHNIFMAYVDDGYICFPIIDDQPCIRFVDRYEYTPKVVQKYTIIDSDTGPSFGNIDHLQEVTFLDTYQQFIETIESKVRQELKNYFYEELICNSKEEAIRCYGKGQFYNPAWADQKIDDITYNNIEHLIKFNQYKKSIK